MSSSVSGSRASTSERDSRGETTENDGFSVVAATSSTSRSSTALEQGVLLGPAEPVDLVDEQHGLLPAVATPARVVDHGSEVLHARRERGQGDEVPVPCRRSFTRSAFAPHSEEPGERRLPGAGRPVQHDRRRGAALHEPAQRRARRQQVGLPDDLVERARAHPHGQGRAGAAVRLGRRFRLQQVEQAVHAVHCARTSRAASPQRSSSAASVRVVISGFSRCRSDA